MLTRCGLATLLAFSIPTTLTHAADAPPILRSDAAKPGDLVLVDAARVADLYVDAADHEVVRIAAGLFSRDVSAVTGKAPAIKNDAAALGAQAVIIGTIGKSALVDRLIAEGKLDVTAVRGKWETFVIATVERPLPNVERALVIAGSDRRGTAFGTLELSEQIGVSAWNWWADIHPTQRETLTVQAGTHIVGPPSVKYRGIFINDEDWGLTPWAAKTFEPERGNIGPKTYERVFELLLRLKANYLWPAMHPVSTEFGEIAENSVLADRWGIVMGASHAEPMNRNNVHWNRENRGPWRYDTNRDGVYKYWEEYAQKRGKFEAVWTVGMRGIHDSGMGGPRDVRDQATLLGKVIEDQRTLLAKYVNPNVAAVPQAFMPYKEALTQYQAGLKVPDDVTLVWCEDNVGFLRQLSTPEEQKRAGRAGVYYHISYLGTPKPYLWINTTPPALIWTEMQKALAYGADQIWVLNVGDIKPAEIGMEFWMRLAWKADRWDVTAQDAFLREWSTRNFGPEHAADIAAILNDYYRLGFQRKPELMETGLFSTTAYNEASRRNDEYAELLSRTKAVSDKLPAEKRDGFYETVLYPVLVATHTNAAYLNADLSTLYAGQQRPVANDYARRANEAYAALETETAYFNKTLAGGKWDGMMQIAGWGRTGEYTNWGNDWFMQWPKGTTIAPATESKFGIAVEGRPIPLINGQPIAGLAEEVRWPIGDTAELLAPLRPIGDGANRGIGIPNGVGTQSDATKSPTLTLPFNIVTPGRYNLFARVTAPTADDDSFFIRLDDGPWLTWNDIAQSDSPAWRKQGAHELKAGPHTLSIAPREDGAVLHAIRLSQRDKIDASDAVPLPTTDLPTFANTPGRDRVVLTLYRTGNATKDQSRIESSAPWIKVGEFADAHGGERRFAIWIDWNAAPADGALNGTIAVLAADKRQTLNVRAVRASTDGRFFEIDGAVSIEAEHFARSNKTNTAIWQTIPHLGRSGDAVTIAPATAPSLKDVADVMARGPSLEYDFETTTAGPAKVMAYCLPTYRIHEGRGLRYAVSIDDGQPTIVDFNESGGGAGEHGDRWRENKSRNISVNTTDHRIDQPGRHTLKLWAVDPGVVVDKLVIDLGGVQPSELGPPETRATK